ncbi:MAG: hypothetical protein KAY24_00060 [Candidatus Eisenbacteria sp.]|nr:hypothetical protein [Candidatus Eisenbacteria bacterium]
MGMVVTFWRTGNIEKPQKEEGRVVLAGDGVSGPKDLVELLFPKGVPKKAEAIRPVLRGAPLRFDGRYLRAEVKE